jgi:hypothetical protein
MDDDCKDSETCDWRKCINEMRNRNETEQKLPQKNFFTRKHWESKPLTSIFKSNETNVLVEHSNRFGVLIFAENKFLMVRQTSNGFLGPQKGSQETIEIDGKQVVEDNFITGQRENMEECGCWIEMDDLKQSIPLVIQPEEKYGKKTYTFYLLAAEKQFKCLVDNVEIDHYVWMSEEEIQKCKKASFTFKLFVDLFKRKRHLLEKNALHKAKIIVPIITEQDKAEKMVDSNCSNYDFFSKTLTFEERSNWSNIYDQSPKPLEPLVKINLSPTKNDSSSESEQDLENDSLNFKNGEKSVESIV